VPRALVYDTTMYILSGLLVIGFICNLLIKPVAESVYMTPEELEAERRAAHDKSQPVAAESPQVQIAQGSINPAYALLAWGAVGIPLAWGVYITLLKVAALF
jgi:hypothetical protein